MMFTFPADKRGEILQSSLDVFATYGFRKTSMDDLARAANMSRPALYQFFKNKKDIFRALSEHLLERAIILATQALEGDGAFHDRFYKAIDVSMLTIHRLLLASPHGQEIVGINEEIASDIDALWKQRLGDVLVTGMHKAIDNGEFNLGNFTPEQLIKIFMYAMEGLRCELHCTQSAEQDAQLLVSFIMQSAPSAQISQLVAD